MEREWRRFFLREVRKFIKAAPMPAAEKRSTRQKLAKLLRLLRGRAQAAEKQAEHAERVAAENADHCWDLAQKLANAERERDDALMQASAAAERAHALEQEVESLRELGRVVEDLERERTARDREDES